MFGTEREGIHQEDAENDIRRFIINILLQILYVETRSTDGTSGKCIRKFSRKT